MSIDLSTIIALGSVVGTIVTAVSFFNRLKWDNQRHDEEIKKQIIDINRLGEKVNSIKDTIIDEQRNTAVKIDTLDKTMIEVFTTLKHVQATITEIKEKLP